MKASLAATIPARVGLLAVTLIAFGACESTGPDDEVITITGSVVDAGSGATVENAVVRIANLQPPAVTQTGSAGEYAFELEILTAQELILIATKEGYQGDTIQAWAIPEQDLAVSDLRLSLEGQGGGGTPPPGSSRTGPKSIVLSSISDESVLVKESGGRETTDITFEVRDSTGLPLDLGSGVDVRFMFGAAPGGGETLFPTTATTNANGRATTSLHSGTAAGVVQVVAEVSHNGNVIRSRPASVAIHGGLPDQTHFGIGVQQFNMPFVQFGFENAITAIAGDKYGNIATPGTAVYFSTTGGIIEGSAATNEKGAATVGLISNNPFPTHELYGPGYAVVTAQTANENNQPITTNALVLMSGNAQISGVSPGSFSLGNGGAQSFSFTVSDQHGNPLTPGTTISVEAGSQAVNVAGNVDVELADALFGGPGITDFGFTVSDADADTDELVSVTITIRVTGDNGTAQATISGSAR